jgi:hypothetical protein
MELPDLAKSSLVLSHFGVQGFSTLSFYMASEELAATERNFLDQTGLVKFKE